MLEDLVKEVLCEEYKKKEKEVIFEGINEEYKEKHDKYEKELKEIEKKKNNAFSEFKIQADVWQTKRKALGKMLADAKCRITTVIINGKTYGVYTNSYGAEIEEIVSKKETEKRIAINKLKECPKSS